MISTLIIDDEKNVRLRIRDLILENFPDISIVGESNGVKSGKGKIDKLKPELLLLDIQMEDGNTFDLFGKVKHHISKVTVLQDL